MPAIMELSVTDPDLFKKVDTAVKQKKRVRIHVNGRKAAKVKQEFGVKGVLPGAALSGLTGMEVLAVVAVVIGVVAITAIVGALIAGYTLNFRYDGGDDPNDADDDDVIFDLTPAI